MNVLTIKKEAFYLRGNDIYIWGGTLGTSERFQRVKRSNVPFERFAQIVLADVPGKPFLFKTEIVTFSPLCRFSEFSMRGI